MARMMKVMFGKKLFTFKIVNIVIAVLGVFMTIYIHRFFFRQIGDVYQGRVEHINIFQYIFFYLNEFILLLFLFLDFTRKRRISLIVTILMLITAVYSFAALGLPVVYECWDFNSEPMIRGSFSVLIRLLELPFLYAFILLYLLKKNKTNLFWIYNIYLLPVIFFLCSFDWFSYDPWKEKVTTYFSNFPCSILTWLLLSISLHVRFVYQKMVNGSIQQGS